jgi:hypothetical protein
MDENKEGRKTLKDILTEGYNWHSGLSAILADLCKRVEELEKNNK